MMRRPHSMDELFVDSGNQAEPVRSQRPGSSLTIPVGREVRLGPPLSQFDNLHFQHMKLPFTGDSTDSPLWR